MPISLADLPQWIVTVGASAATGAGAFVLALVNRGPAMQAAFTEMQRTLNEGYRQRTDDLMAEVKELRREVIELRKALDTAKDEREGCAKSMICENAILR